MTDNGPSTKQEPIDADDLSICICNGLVLLIVSVAVDASIFEQVPFDSSPIGVMLTKSVSIKMLGVLGVCLLGIGATSIAPAQSLAPPQTSHHAHMDAQAARKDIRHLKVILKRCKKYHNTRKAEQTQRLIDADLKFIREDAMRQKHRHGG